MHNPMHFVMVHFCQAFACSAILNFTMKTHVSLYFAVGSLSFAHSQKKKNLWFCEVIVTDQAFKQLTLISFTFLSPPLSGLPISSPQRDPKL